MNNMVILREVLNRIAELEKENAEILEELEYYNKKDELATKA